LIKGSKLGSVNIDGKGHKGDLAEPDVENYTIIEMGSRTYRLFSIDAEKLRIEPNNFG
jgi:hypothetical protein